MDQDQRLRLIAVRHTRYDRTKHLGRVLNEFMEKRVAPSHSRFASVEQLWGQLLPAELAEHCTLAGISAGQLKVLVDSPVYMHELRMCGGELVRQLQQHCPRARIERIKFAIG